MSHFSIKIQRFKFTQKQDIISNHHGGHDWRFFQHIQFKDVSIITFVWQFYTAEMITEMLVQVILANKNTEFHKLLQLSAYFRVPWPTLTLRHSNLLINITF